MKKLVIHAAQPLIDARESPKNVKFTQNLVDLWEIRREEVYGSLGLLPANTTRREKIINFLRSSGFINCDKLLWADIVQENIITELNLYIQDFESIDEFYHDYMVNRVVEHDYAMEAALSAPNKTSIKFNDFNPKEYRKSKIYQFHQAYEAIEDSVITHIKNPNNDVSTFMVAYRTGFEEKYFFTEDERQRQHFLLSFLAFNPAYPIAICNKNGRVLYRNYNFWDTCRKEFPQASFSRELPSPLLANLIRWNKQERYKKSYKFVDFKVVQYQNVYCIQASPKILIKQKDMSVINSNKIGQNPLISLGYDDNHIIMPDRKTPSEPSLEDKNTARKTEKSENISEIEQLQQENAELKARVAELEKQNQLLQVNLSETQKENDALKQVSSEYKNSVNDVVKEPEGLTLPETAPELFKGVQSESLGFLEKHYGKYLTYFGADEDLLFQFQLKKLDPRLADAVRGTLNYRRRKDKNAPQYPDIVPPKMKYTDKRIAEFSEADRRTVMGLTRSAQYRNRIKALTK